MDVAPTPKGSTREIGSETTETGSYKEIASYTPADGKTFALSKILVTWAGSDEQDIAVKVDGEIVGEYYSAAYVMDWFPPGVNLVGDDVKKVLIEAKAVTTPATLLGFIEGQVT
jgi:uncharacterized secreted protein with C-terminal beta-propeller domain